VLRKTKGKKDRMPKFNVTREVPYTVDQIFHIASDVANYRTFLPLVKRSVVRNRQVLPDGRETFESELMVAYKKLGIEETMVSQVVVDPAASTVTSNCSNGPIKEMRAVWQVEPAGPGTSVINFTVDYTLKSRSLQFILSGMFDMVVRRIMSAFEMRARQVYGTAAALR
jgi:coenzyme Q-binding protein COQ10